MKSTFLLAAGLALSTPSLTEANQWVVLVDSEAELSEPTDEAPSEKRPTTAPAPSSPKGTLDDLIAKGGEQPRRITTKQQRVYDRILKDQKSFLRAVETFLASDFDADDDKGIPEFVAARDKVIDLIFRAPDERMFYERLYLVNDSWLSNPQELLRFQSLDRGLRDRWMKEEDRRRKIRELVSIGSAVIGTVVGGYLSYKVAERALPIIADDKGFHLILKLAGRTPIVLVGAGVGAAAGRYAGFLGADYLMGRQWEFIDPVDGSDNLDDLLDLIDDL